MRKLRQIALLAFLFILFDYIYFKGSSSISSDETRKNVYFIATVCFLLSLSLTLLYKWAFRLSSHPIMIVLCLAFCVSVSGYLAGRMTNFTTIYDDIFKPTTQVRRIEGDFYRWFMKGYGRGVPNGKAMEYFRLGDSLEGRVPLRLDSLGFRNVSPDMMVKSDTLNLFLGCSYSFGDLQRDHHVYPYLVSKSIGHSQMNASMNGYGLLQMRVMMDSLLPSRRFKYVFIQASPWLALRSMGISMMYTKLVDPVHYFTQTDDGIEIAPPVFQYQIPYQLLDWSNHRRSYSDRLKYAFRFGYPVYLKPYLLQDFARLKILLRLVPRPVDDKLALEKWFYEKAISDVRSKGAIPVVVKMFWNDKDFAGLESHLRGKALIIDCDDRLSRLSDSSGRTWEDLYHVHALYKGRRIRFDPHPNALANRLIADEILLRLPEAY
jgi:hypothetical protein